MFEIPQELSAQEQEQLQSGLEKLQQMSQIQENIFELTDLCWDKCVSSTKKQNDKQDQICMLNCVERFLDATSVIIKSVPAFEKLDLEN